MKKINSLTNNLEQYFCQIGFQKGMTLVLMLESKESFPFPISITEEMFLFFIPCFYDSFYEYIESNSGQYIVTKTYEEISNRFNIIGELLLSDEINYKILKKFFSELIFSNCEIERYIKYINKYKPLFELATIQIREWLEIYKKDTNVKLVIYGY